MTPGSAPRPAGCGPSARAGPRRSPAPIHLREARPADARACAAVMRAAIRALPPGAVTARQRAAWSSLPALYHRWAMGPGGETYLVAERTGRTRQLLGYAALRGAELTAAFVRPGAQRGGVGRALVGAAAARLRAAGAPSLTVIAARPAVAFYGRLGFQARRSVRAPLPGGGSLPAVRMALQLR